MSEQQLPLLDTDLQAHDPIPLPEEWSRLAPDLESLEKLEKASRVEREEFCGQVLNEMVRTYEALRLQGLKVAEQIWADGQADLPSYMVHMAGEPNLETRQKAIEAVLGWTFAPDQDPNETEVYRGAVSSSDATLTEVQRLNELKGEFSKVHKTLLKALTRDSAVRGDMAALIGMVVPAERKILRAQEVGALVRSFLHPRLSVKQLLRSVPIVDCVPRSVRWRWVESASSVRVSKQELLSLLEKRVDQAFVKLDMERVLAATGDEHFVLRRKPVRNLRIQLQLPKDSDSEKSHMIIKSRLPLFYRQAEPGAWRQTPDFSISPDNAPSSKRKRRVEETAFLETLPAHRYVRQSDETTG
jgi:hypothetical protein